MSYRILKLLIGAIGLTAIARSFHSNRNVLSCQRVMKDAIRHAPKQSNFAQVALLHEPSETGVKVTCAYLDRDHNMCVDRQGRAFGRTWRAAQLDAELKTLFQSTDLVLLR